MEIRCAGLYSKRRAVTVMLLLFRLFNAVLKNLEKIKNFPINFITRKIE